jgi:hypothetical protein
LIKLLDALGGIVLALLSLSGLILSVGATHESFAAAEGALARSAAAGAAVSILDERTVLRSAGVPDFAVGNLTCGFAAGRPGPPLLEWSFRTVAGRVAVVVKCTAP